MSRNGSALTLEQYMNKLSKEQSRQIAGGSAAGIGFVGAVGAGALAGFASPVPGGAIFGAVGAGIAFGITRLCFA
jgi:hypothetical protein